LGCNHHSKIYKSDWVERGLNTWIIIAKAFTGKGLLVNAFFFSVHNRAYSKRANRMQQELILILYKFNGIDCCFAVKKAVSSPVEISVTKSGWQHLMICKILRPSFFATRVIVFIIQ